MKKVTTEERLINDLLLKVMMEKIPVRDTIKEAFEVGYRYAKDMNINVYIGEKEESN